MPVLHMPFPSLMTLDVSFRDPGLFQNSFEFFPKYSPDIRRLSIRLYSPAAIDGFVKIEVYYMRCWQIFLL